MGWLENAPFISAYGPYVVSVLGGYLFFTLAERLRAGGRDARHSLQRSDSKRVSFADESSRADEDNYVFQDTEHGAGEAADAGDAFDPEANAQHIPYTPEQFSDDVMVQRSRSFYEQMNRRRSCRFFSDKPVPQEIVDNIIRTAGTSPSGAHTEPWTFVVISSSKMKAKVREIIEDEEEINYKKRMGDKWVNDLSKIGTNWHKPYLEIAPYIVIVFKQSYGEFPDGSRRTHYYNELSVAISVGLLLAAIQNAGLVSVTTTPMNSGPRLRMLLGRPVNEKVILLLPIGHPAEGATVPDFKRKRLEQILVPK